jgi:hypothetical protein
MAAPAPAPSQKAGINAFSLKNAMLPKKSTPRGCLGASAIPDGWHFHSCLKSQPLKGAARQPLSHGATNPPSPAAPLAPAIDHSCRTRVALRLRNLPSVGGSPASREPGPPGWQASRRWPCSIGRSPGTRLCARSTVCTGDSTRASALPATPSPAPDRRHNLGSSSASTSTEPAQQQVFSATPRQMSRAFDLLPNARQTPSVSLPVSVCLSAGRAPAGRRAGAPKNTKQKKIRQICLPQMLSSCYWTLCIRAPTFFNMSSEQQT